MILKMKKIFYTLVFAALAACTEIPVEQVPEQIPVNPDAVAFSADIRSVTRATDTSFEEGDQISVFATEKRTVQVSNYAQNVRYTYHEGLFVTDEELVYPDENTTLSFFAVYPYGDYTTPEFDFAVNRDQSVDGAYSESDLMTASQVAKDQDIVDLTFNHRMTKVIINLTAKNLPAGDQSVVFKDVLYNATADLADNLFRGTGNASDIVACPNGTNSFKVILAPQTITRGTEFVNVTIGNKKYVWEVESDLILSSGVEYTYTLTLKENNVSFTSNINPWNVPSDIEAVIPEEYVETMSPYIPIYEGTTPPNIEGIWLVSPNELYYESMGGTKDDYNFAPDYIWFYNQTSDNRLNMDSTQNLGDLSVAEGVFVSGSGNNFTVYFNEYSVYDDSSWVITATLISGTKNVNSIKNMRKAFVILDKYDPNDELMDLGEFRVLEDGDYSSGRTEWPLETKSAVNGDYRFIKK